MAAVKCSFCGAIITGKPYRVDDLNFCNQECFEAYDYEYGYDEEED